MCSECLDCVFDSSKERENKAAVTFRFKKPVCIKPVKVPAIGRCSHLSGDETVGKCRPPLLNSERLQCRNCRLHKQAIISRSVCEDAEASCQERRDCQLWLIYSL